MSSFHDVEFPREISYGSKGGPRFKTTINTLASGLERRNQDWTRVRSEYDVSHGIKNIQQEQQLRDFFMARRGAANSFRFFDWSDHKIIGQVIAYGDGTNKIFQIIKTYERDTSYQYDRIITKPIPGTLTQLQVNGVPKTEGVDFSINYINGLVGFINAPEADAEIYIDEIDFHVHCRLDTDLYDPIHEFWTHVSWQSIPLVEVKAVE